MLPRGITPERGLRVGAGWFGAALVRRRVAGEEPGVVLGRKLDHLAVRVYQADVDHLAVGVPGGGLVRVGDKAVAVRLAVVLHARVPHGVLVLYVAGTVVEDEVVPLRRHDGFGLRDLGRRCGRQVARAVGVEGRAEKVVGRGIAHVHHHGRGDSQDVDHAVRCGGHGACDEEEHG